MKHFLELEKRVTSLLENNKNLKKGCEALTKEKAELLEANAKLENLLLKENNNVDSLTKEKDELKVAIENLIESIDKFSAAQ